MNLRRLHLPSVGILVLLLGAILRIFSFIFAWPVLLVFLSNILLLMALWWMVLYDFFPLFLPVFETFREKFRRRVSFFVSLLILFGAMQFISYLLPSGGVRDTTTTLAFLSFASSIIWIIVANLLVAFTPLLKYLRRQPREAERITFADILTSMAIILSPTIILSFFFIPPGLSTYSFTPYQLFVTSLLTDTAILAYLFLFVIRPHLFTWRQLGLRRVEREDVGHAFLLFLLVGIFLVIIYALFQRLGVSLQQFVFTSKQGSLLAFIILVVLTPLIEEIYFRGFLFRGLLLHNKAWLAYIISAGLFALLHPPLVVMINVFVVGLLLNYLVKETKSIWPGVLIHSLNNALVLGYFFLK